MYFKIVPKQSIQRNALTELKVQMSTTLFSCFFKVKRWEKKTENVGVRTEDV